MGLLGVVLFAPPSADIKERSVEREREKDEEEEVIEMEIII